MVTPKTARLSKIADSFKNDGEIWGALKWNHIASTLFFDINPPRSLQMVLEGRAVRDAGSLSLLFHFTVEAQAAHTNCSGVKSQRGNMGPPG